MHVSSIPRAPLKNLFAFEVATWRLKSMSFMNSESDVRFANYDLSQIFKSRRNKRISGAVDVAKCDNHYFVLAWGHSINNILFKQATLPIDLPTI